MQSQPMERCVSKGWLIYIEGNMLSEYDNSHPPSCDTNECAVYKDAN